MGLDVYLYRCDDWQKALADEALFEKRSEAIWEKIKNGRDYSALSEAERNDAQAQTDALSAQMGLDKYGYSAGREKIETSSAIDPEHICKVGYLRSSYNEGGFDRVVSNAIGVDGFHYIFDRNRDDDYLFAPDWRQAHARAEEIATKLAKETLRVSCISPNVFGSAALPADEMEALEIARKELERKQGGAFAGSAYSNNTGHYFPGEMLKIRAMIPGTTSILRRGHPCVYVVYEADITHYVNSARIAAETCAYVLAHPKPQTFRLAWSS